MLRQVKSSKCFGGEQKVLEHESKELDCRMTFAVFLPSNSQVPGVKLQTVYFLSGYGRKVEDMITMSGFQLYAEELKLVVVCPDTIPRGCSISGEGARHHYGSITGFYVDATEEPWSKHYKMYSYVTKELRDLVEQNFACVDRTRVGIMGHSMGGHGALVCFFRNPQIYKAVTVFAPLSNPMKSTWGAKCMAIYLGEDCESWKGYDATELVKLHPRKDVKVLVDFGSLDEYMTHLCISNFVAACNSVGQPVDCNERLNYDHGYYFVATFIADHLRYFSRVL